VKFIATLFAACAIACAQTQQDKIPEIVTDRPDITEAAIVIPKRSLQFENGFMWSSGREGKFFDVAETLVRYGLAPRTELRIVVPNYLRSLSGQQLGTGFDDIALGIKQQIGPLRGGFELSVIAGTTLPTGASRISSHGYDPFVKFPWAKELKAGWSIGGMQSIFWQTEDGQRNGVWEPTFYLEKELTKPWDAFVEYAGDFAQRGGPKEIAHFGSAYRVTERHQVDFHFGVGLSAAAPDRFFAFGYSFRVDPPRQR
jgi:hypothetical protein